MNQFKKGGNVFTLSPGKFDSKAVIEEHTVKSFCRKYVTIDDGGRFFVRTYDLKTKSMEEENFMDPFPRRLFVTKEDAERMADCWELEEFFRKINAWDYSYERLRAAKEILCDGSALGSASETVTEDTSDAFSKNSFVNRIFGQLLHGVDGSNLEEDEYARIWNYWQDMYIQHEEQLTVAESEAVLKALKAVWIGLNAMYPGNSETAYIF